MLKNSFLMVYQVHPKLYQIYNSIMVAIHIYRMWRTAKMKVVHTVNGAESHWKWWFRGAKIVFEQKEHLRGSSLDLGPSHWVLVQVIEQ